MRKDSLYKTGEKVMITEEVREKLKDIYGFLNPDGKYKIKFVADRDTRYGYYIQLPPINKYKELGEVHYECFVWEKDLLPVA